MKKIALLMFILTFFYTLKTHAQPWYGQLGIVHDSTILSSAKRTFKYPGYILASFRPVRQSGTNGAAVPDFAIDKLDASGAVSSSTDWNLEFQFQDDTICGNGVTPRRNCAGISIIETVDQGNGETYAFVASHNRGVFFATLGAAGNIIHKASWVYPYRKSYSHKPCIRLSADQSYYYICASGDENSYVMKVDPTGSQIWGNNYDLTEARDLIESPYYSDELVVVGSSGIMSFNPTAEDAFFMRLNSSNGNIATPLVDYWNFRTWDSDDWFSSIEIANSTAGGSNGYVLGGRAVGFPTNPNVIPRPNKSYDYCQWMCKVDPTGARIWTSMMLPAFHLDTILTVKSGSEINRVYERYNSNSAQYEYYGVGAAGCWINNFAVYKLNDYGNTSGLSPTEFHYLSGLSPDAIKESYSDITGIETGGGTDDGIQAFATLYGRGNLFVKAYFNGSSGCKDTLMDIAAIISGPEPFSQFLPSITPIDQCNTIQLTYNTNGIVYSNCYAPSLASGSNAKNALGIANPNYQEEIFSLYPNPVNNKVCISVPASIEGNVRAVIFNNLGQKINEYNFNSLGNDQFEINFEKLNIQSGFYTVCIKTGNKESSYKLLYNKQ